MNWMNVMQLLKIYIKDILRIKMKCMNKNIIIESEFFVVRYMHFIKKINEIITE
jgi:hypothetical protein